VFALRQLALVPAVPLVAAQESRVLSQQAPLQALTGPRALAGHVARFAVPPVDPVGPSEHASVAVMARLDARLAPRAFRWEDVLHRRQGASAF